MKYCSKCILPDTRPHLTIGDDGICNACKNSVTKKVIDWELRNQQFKEVVANAKSKSKGHDCIIPVSGGKDSTWQVLKCKEYGLRPLCVTWAPWARTEIGRKNLKNLISLGVDHIDYSINPEVEKKFLYKALTSKGIPGIPMHMAIFNIPAKIAVKFQIPLIIYGENSSFEYGSNDIATQGAQLTPQWYKDNGVTSGTTAEDWISEELTRSEMTPYFGPSKEEMAQNDFRAIFLGHYFQWDPQDVYAVAKKNGFENLVSGAKTGLYDFADIDDDFISVHHYLKWFKFGFTRTWDNLTQEIRNNRLTREEAVAHLQKIGEELPKSDILKFCDYINISYAHFFDIAETFRNKNIWIKEGSKWKIKDFLIKDWNWK